MTRVKSERGAVHYRCPADMRMTLCGAPAGERTRDLFGGEYRAWKETTERVICPDCAKVICACRNEPYNTLNAEVEDATMMRGIYAAVQPDGPVPPAGEECLCDHCAVRDRGECEQWLEGNEVIEAVCCTEFEEARQ